LFVCVSVSSSVVIEAKPCSQVWLQHLVW
jgi:hypothetical protein